MFRADVFTELCFSPVRMSVQCSDHQVPTVTKRTTVLHWAQWQSCLPLKHPLADRAFEVRTGHLLPTEGEFWEKTGEKKKVLNFELLLKRNTSLKSHGSRTLQLSAGENNNSLGSGIEYFTPEPAAFLWKDPPLHFKCSESVFSFAFNCIQHCKCYMSLFFIGCNLKDLQPKQKTIHT